MFVDNFYDFKITMANHPNETIFSKLNAYTFQ